MTITKNKTFLFLFTRMHVVMPKRVFFDAKPSILMVVGTCNWVKSHYPLKANGVMTKKAFCAKNSRHFLPQF